MVCTTLAICMTVWMTAHDYPKSLQTEILSYVRHESDFHSDIIERTGSCAFQWAGERRRHILAIGHGKCPSWTEQMEYMDWELRNEPRFRQLWLHPERFRKCFGRGKC